MKNLIALLAFVSVPAFAADTYTCMAANTTDRIQTVTFELGQNGPVDYVKINSGGSVISGMPAKVVSSDGVTTYNLNAVRASYIITITEKGETSIWVPANGSMMACHL